jgi:ankyrin repeat protein
MSNALIDLLFRPPVDHAQLRVLLAGGCDPNHANASGMTALKAAVMNCDREIVETLLRHGAEVDSQLAQFADLRYPHKCEVCAVIRAQQMMNTIDGLSGDRNARSANGPVARRRIRL